MAMQIQINSTSMNEHVKRRAMCESSLTFFWKIFDTVVEHILDGLLAHMTNASITIPYMAFQNKVNLKMKHNLLVATLSC